MRRLAATVQREGRSYELATLLDLTPRDLLHIVAARATDAQSWRDCVVSLAPRTSPAISAALALIGVHRGALRC